MPIKRIARRSSMEYADLLPELVSAFRSDIQAEEPGGPIITWEEPGDGDLRVRVIWEKWEGVDVADRGQLILDAIEEALGDERVARISLVMGMTSSEAKRTELEAEVARVLRCGSEQGPAAEPEIVVEEFESAGKKRVRVVWDRWAGIESGVRKQIILDAIEDVWSDDQRSCVVEAAGLTSQEADRTASHGSAI
jgi:hypothetical protein